MAWAGEDTGKTKHVSNKIFFINTSKPLLTQRSAENIAIHSRARVQSAPASLDQASEYLYLLPVFSAYLGVLCG
jgi:hypothetical protein